MVLGFLSLKKLSLVNCAAFPSEIQLSYLQTNFYKADGQVLCLSAMKRVTTSNLDCKATTIRIIFSSLSILRVHI